MSHRVFLWPATDLTFNLTLVTSIHPTPTQHQPPCPSTPLKRWIHPIYRHKEVSAFRRQNLRLLNLIPHFRLPAVAHRWTHAPKINLSRNVERQQNLMLLNSNPQLPVDLAPGSYRSSQICLWTYCSRFSNISFLSIFSVSREHPKIFVELSSQLNLSGGSHIPTSPSRHLHVPRISQNLNGQVSCSRLIVL